MRSFIAGVVAGLVAIILAVWLYPWSIEGSAEPTAAERWLMTRLIDKAIAREAPRATNPFVTSDERLLAGMKFYVSNCAGCHGDGKQASLWGTTSFFPRPPQFGTHPTPRQARHSQHRDGRVERAGRRRRSVESRAVRRPDRLIAARVAAQWRGEAPTP